jgi:hypothetical protein
MKRTFKTRYFSRWMRKTELSDELLYTAICEMEQGLIDADLGGSLFKKRIALPRKGKSGSTRTLLATNKNDRWFFVFGYEKKERANINKTELSALKTIAADLLSYSDAELNKAVTDNKLEELFYESEKK